MVFWTDVNFMIHCKTGTFASRKQFYENWI